MCVCSSSMCCIVLQYIAVCYSVLQVFDRCDILLRTRTHRISCVAVRVPRQGVAGCCKVLQSVAECFRVLQCVAAVRLYCAQGTIISPEFLRVHRHYVAVCFAICCSVLQPGSVLQRTAVCCSCDIRLCTGNNYIS